jgi:hypothetical protein
MEKNKPSDNVSRLPSLTGDHEVVYVASDRELTSQEILDAAQKYL